VGSAFKGEKGGTADEKNSEGSDESTGILQELFRGQRLSAGGCENKNQGEAEMKVSSGGRDTKISRSASSRIVQSILTGFFLKVEIGKRRQGMSLGDVLGKGWLKNENKKGKK